MYCIAADSAARRGHHHRVIHRAVLLELADHRRNGRVLLPDRDVDAPDARALLIDDGVDRDRGLAGLAVADDELALAPADRDHRVDGLEPGLHRLPDRLAGDHPGRDLLDGKPILGLDRAAPVDRLTEGVDHPSEHPSPHRNLEDPARASHHVSLGDVLVVPEHDGAHRVALQVQRETVGVAGELDHLALHHVAQAMNASDPVRQGHDAPFGPRLGPDLEAFDPFADEFADFRRAEFHYLLRSCLRRPARSATGARTIFRRDRARARAAGRRAMRR